MDKDADTIAEELRSWVETACAELAHGEHGYGLKGEIQADENYNDPDLIHDLLADRVSDECRNDADLALAVLQELERTMAHLPDTMWASLRLGWVRRKLGLPG